MRSYDFMVAAKNATIDLMKKDYNIDVTVEDIEIVWFSHVLGYKKCTLYASQFGSKYVEATYNKEEKEMYIDIYTKEHNVTIPEVNFNYNVEGL